MPLILASLFSKMVDHENKSEADKAYLIVSVFTTVGLMIWGFFQINSQHLFFDPYDIAATFAGTLLAYFFFHRFVRPKISGKNNARQTNSGDTG